jgi:hypothetical protein
MAVPQLSFRQIRDRVLGPLTRRTRTGSTELAGVKTHQQLVYIYPGGLGPYPRGRLAVRRIGECFACPWVLALVLGSLAKG